ncbi:restriction endonuclease subunit S [Flavobacterium sp. ZT3R17]|uniref:restriction endonuclease subunit S n=1 Tax=Flavobacterium cryoconiti TaxID=3398736 RepID=UPI003A8A2FBC
MQEKYKSMSNVPNYTTKVPNRGIFPKLRFKEYTGKWTETPFSDVGIFLKGKGISKDQLTEEGTRCILYGELYTKYKNEIIKEVFSKTSIDPKGLVVSENNDVIIPSSGETAIDIATACCVNLDSVLLGGDLNIIRPHKDNGNFISYQLNGKRKQDIAKIAQGSSVTHLYNDSLKKLKIFLPEDRDEQDKIATFLSLIDDQIQTQNKIIEELKVLKSSISKKIFSQQLRFKDDNGNNFPDWEVNILGELCKVYDGTHQTPNYVDNGIPFFSVEHLTANQFNKTKYISEKVYEKENKKVKLEKGDILMTKIGSIGVAKYINWDVKASFYVSLALIKKSIEIDNEYLCHFINTDFFQSELWKRTIHVAFPQKINLGEISECLVKIPALLEQTKIANFLSSIDEKIEVEILLLNQLQSQKQYLLSNLFI